MRLQFLIEELERQKPLKWDKRTNSSELEMTLFEDALRFKINGGDSFPITKPCHNQIAEKLEIPLKYYHKMGSEAPELLARNVNTWPERSEKDFFIRGMGDSVRAFLSDRYRVIDHLDVLLCALNELQAHSAEIEDCFLSEIEMNIKVKSQGLRDFVRHKDDLIMGGLFLTNSETGHKALRIEPRLFRVKCSNGMIIEEFITRLLTGMEKKVRSGRRGYHRKSDTFSTAAPSIRLALRSWRTRFASFKGKTWTVVCMGISAAIFNNPSPSCRVALATLRSVRSW